MAVDDSKVIDFVGVDKMTGEVVLTISDHLDWTDSTSHQYILQAKLNSYLAFVESGELLQQYSDAKGRLVAFNVIFKFRPDAQGMRFLEKVKVAIEGAGFTLAYKVSTDVM
jgi:hypothetical protein